jgi:hypothetical protein
MNELYEMSNVHDFGSYVSGQITVKTAPNQYMSFTVYPPKSIIREGNKVSKNAIKNHSRNPAIPEGVL